MPKLILYIAYPCPFCIRVTDFMEEHNINTIEIIDTKWDRDKHLDLQSKYGKTSRRIKKSDKKIKFDN